MDNDLISRSALKKSMRKSMNERYISWTKTITVADIATLIFDEINYAPTVSAYTFKEVEEIRQAAIEQTRISCKYERPHGVWVGDSGVNACSHCHTIWLYRKTDYCPHCGGYMGDNK